MHVYGTNNQFTKMGQIEKKDLISNAVDVMCSLYIRISW
jgi:hypothetical protein